MPIEDVCLHPCIVHAMNNGSIVPSVPIALAFRDRVVPRVRATSYAEQADCLFLTCSSGHPGEPDFAYIDLKPGFSFEVEASTLAEV